MAKIKVTKNNYYDREVANEYWSASLVKTFADCPARAIAELNGEYEREATTALLVGSFVDAAFEGQKSFMKFKMEHKDIFKKDGTLKSDYVRAIEMINRAKSDKVFMDFMRGRKQTIRTGKIDGFMFRSKFDVYLKGERIVDLKTVRDFEPVYRPGKGKMDYITAWDWPLQMAIYQAVEGNHLPTYLAVISKEESPSLDLVQIPQDRLDAELEWLKEKLPEWDAMRMGIVEPERCECCAYCRRTKKLSTPRQLETLED